MSVSTASPEMACPTCFAPKATKPPVATRVKKLDALIAPSLGPAWLTDHINGDHFLAAGYGMSAVAGTPSLSVPAGDAHGLPLGVTFMGRAYSEGELIGFGYALEQTLKARKPPTYKTTLTY